MEATREARTARLLCVTHAAEETRALGRRLGALLRPGDVVLLYGELGAGKTCLAQGVGEALDAPEPVNSPSFILLNEYAGRLVLYHADLYRIADPGEAFDLGLGTYTTDGVLVVEWPERAEAALPAGHLALRLEHAGGDVRRVLGWATDARHERLLEALARAG